MRSTLLCAAVSAVALTSAAPAVAQAPPAAATTTPALEEYGACLAGAGSGDLLLLLDQSGSLRQTDPRDERVDASRLLLEQLTASAAAAGLELDVSIAGFDADYREAAAWRRLDAKGLPRLVETVEQFRDRDSGIDTDYWTALEGARRSLRAKAAGKSRCQAIVWLTDGAFDVAPRLSKRTREAYDRRKPYVPEADLTTRDGAAEARAAGRTALCEPKGLADQLRASDVTLLAVGLQADTAAGDFAFVQGVATGAEPGGSRRCGASTKAVVGDFRLANDLDDVVFAFNVLAHPAAPPKDQTKKVCPKAACVAQAHAFVLDDSISTVTVLAGASDTGIDVSLQPPGAAKPLVFRYDRGAPSGSATSGGSTVARRWVTARSLSLALRRGAGAGWTGAWSVTFIDPTGTRPAAVSRTQISLEGDIVPGWPKKDAVELRAGEVVPGITFGLLSEANGNRVAPEALLGSGQLVVALRTRDGEERAVATLPVRAAERPVDLDLREVEPGEVTVRLRLALTTAGLPAAGGRPAVAGTALADKVVDLRLAALPPLNYPRVTGDVDFGAVEGAGPKQGRLTVTGPGCVWLQGAEVSALPNGSGDATVTSSAESAGSCLDLAPGEEASLPLSLRLGASGNGAVGGELLLSLAPPGAPERALVQRVPFLGDAQKPLRTSTAVGAFVVALLLGLGLPVLFLYALACWTARIPPVGLLAGLVPVTLEGGQALRDGGQFDVQNRDVDPVSVGGGRSVQLLDGIRLRTRVSRVPGEGGFVVVEAPGRVSTAGRSPYTTGDGTSARLPLAVHNSWSLLHDPVTKTAHVLVLAVSTAKTTVFEQITADVRRDAPALLAKLRAHAGEPPQGEVSGGTGGETWFGGAPATGAETAQPTWFSGDVTPGSAPPPAAPAAPPSARPAGPSAPPTVPGTPPPPPPPIGGDWFSDGSP